jgi:putative membrane protein
MSVSTPATKHLGPATDVTRRTRLADERTYLAWIRTGLSCFAVSVGVGKVVPALTHDQRWPYEILGAGFAIIGLAVAAFGLYRHRAVELALSRGEDVRVNEKVITGIVGGVILLGMVLLGIVLSQ